jgi:hypothetical protein
MYSYGSAHWEAIPMGIEYWHLDQWLEEGAEKQRS